VGKIPKAIAHKQSDKEYTQEQELKPSLENLLTYKIETNG
jgi:hypothetical protein